MVKPTLVNKTREFNDQSRRGGREQRAPKDQSGTWETRSGEPQLNVRWESITIRRPVRESARLIVVMTRGNARRAKGPHKGCISINDVIKRPAWNDRKTATHYGKKRRINRPIGTNDPALERLASALEVESESEAGAEVPVLRTV